MNNKKTKSGFTLIELLMVISIITLLSSMLFSYVGTARAKSRDAVRLSDMKQIGIATNLYYEDKGVLPDSIGGNTNSLVSAGYLSVEPKDLKTGQSYSFTKGNNNKTVVVSGNYESDNQIVAIAVGEVDNNILCSQTFASSTGCSSDGIISGNIVGVTVGRRSGGGSDNGEVTATVSGCSVEDINKICPTPPYLENCYCGGMIKNVDSSLPESECKTEYGLYWDTLAELTCSTLPPYFCTSYFVNRCFDKIACESDLRVWENGVCLPPTSLSVSCESEGNKWLSFVNGGGVCLTQANCEDYIASPYNMYWSAQTNNCEQALLREDYTTQTGCETNGGVWTSYYLFSDNSNSNLGAVLLSSLPTSYKCMVSFDSGMTTNQCLASEGIVDSNWCKTCITNPITCTGNACIPKCVFIP